jgi:predicted MFS family arabinose efflux permease
MYLAAAAAFARLPPVGGGVAPPLVEGLRRLQAELREEIRTIALVPPVRRPLLAVWAHRFLLGGGFILLVLIADALFHLEVSGYGLALAVTGVAALGGTLAAPPLARRFPPLALVPLTFVVAGVAALVAGFEPTLGVLIAGVGAAAFAFQVLKVLVDALVQEAAPDQVRGRVFAAYDVLYNVAFVLAGLALVPLWQPDREQLLLWGVGAAFLAAGLVFAWAPRTSSPAGRRSRRQGPR